MGEELLHGGKKRPKISVYTGQISSILQNWMHEPFYFASPFWMDISVVSNFLLFQSYKSLHPGCTLCESKGMCIFEVHCFPWKNSFFQLHTHHLGKTLPPWGHAWWYLIFSIWESVALHLTFTCFADLMGKKDLSLF